jgi:hypothetical protein
MTGDYCDSQESCCGGSPDQLNPTGYGVVCAPKNAGSPPTCSNGQSCNPPGNICGGSGTVNASQNCCDGKKAVCKADSNGIMRCFGGCPNDNCGNCPTGYDPNRPGCCIEVGQVCQFSDQCCNSIPCVPDSQGVLRCGAQGTCKPQGAECTATNECCAGLGLTCLPGNDGKSYCVTGTPPATCFEPGHSCTSGDQCCTGFCFEGVVCGSCVPNEMSCTSNAQCCSSYCDPSGHCANQGSSSCVPNGGNCTVNGDCCTPDTCDIPPGATSGTCVAPTSTPTCAQTSEACSATMPCCSATDVCNGGVCGPPPPTCSGVSQSCTSDASCCTGLECEALDNNNNRIPCNGTACFCDTPLCKNIGETCSATVACCSGYCADTTDTNYPPCTTSSTACSCVNAL